MTPQQLRVYTSYYNVLYVEDDLALQDATAKLFKQFFASVTVADNGLQALELFEKNSYDVVISDINMPKMNGVEMIEAIRHSKPDQLIMVTSAYSDADNLMQLLELGVDKFIVKPLNLSKLTHALTQVSLYIEHHRHNTQSLIQPLEEEIKALKKEIQSLKQNSA